MQGCKSWALGVWTGIATGLAGYWHDAPKVMHVAAWFLAPMLIVDGATVLWARRVVRRKGPIQGISDADDWERVTVRMIMVFGLVVLAGFADAVTGTPHMTVTWVLLWAASGHFTASLRRLKALAARFDLMMPIFPTETEHRLSQQTGQQSLPDRLEAVFPADLAAKLAAQPALAEAALLSPALAEAIKSNPKLADAIPNPFRAGSPPEGGR